MSIPSWKEIAEKWLDLIGKWQYTFRLSLIFALIITLFTIFFTILCTEPQIMFLLIFVGIELFIVYFAFKRKKYALQQYEYCKQKEKEEEVHQ